MFFASVFSPTIPKHSGILPPHSKNCSSSQQQLLQGYTQLVFPQSLVCKQNLTLPVTVSSLKNPIKFLHSSTTDKAFWTWDLWTTHQEGPWFSQTRHMVMTGIWLLWAPNSQNEWKLTRIKPWFHPQHHIKAGVVAHAYNPRTSDVEVERREKGEHVCGGMLGMLV